MGIITPEEQKELSLDDRINLFLEMNRKAQRQASVLGQVAHLPPESQLKVLALMLETLQDLRRKERADMTEVERVRGLLKIRLDDLEEDLKISNMQLERDQGCDPHHDLKMILLPLMQGVHLLLGGSLAEPDIDLPDESDEAGNCKNCGRAVAQGESCPDC